MTTPSADQAPSQSRIRSFMRREGRITLAQRSALNALWPCYGLADEPKKINPDSLFTQSGRLTMEIGFGNGAALTELARNHPQDRFIGVEVYASGIGCLLNAVEQDALENVRIANADAVELLRDRISDAALDQVCIWFPDPWPKKKHHKRRLIQPAFIALLAQRIKPGGLLMLATDWAPYADHMLEVMEASEQFENYGEKGQFSAKPEARPTTKFERRGIALGHSVFDLVYRRKY